MPGHLPSIDSNSLCRLRHLVAAMHRRDGQPMPFDHLVELAEEVRVEGGLTIDFGASKLVGSPMVVVRVPQARDPAKCFDSLSARERETAALVAEGLSNKEIAKRMLISVATVKDHLHSLLRKTGLPNRTAVALAYIGAQATGSHSASVSNNPGPT